MASQDQTAAQQAMTALTACGVEEDFAQALLQVEDNYAQVCNDPWNYLGDQWEKMDAAYEPACNANELEAALLGLHFRSDLAKSFCQTTGSQIQHIAHHIPLDWAIMIAQGFHNHHQQSQVTVPR